MENMTAVENMMIETSKMMKTAQEALNCVVAANYSFKAGVISKEAYHIISMNCEDCALDDKKQMWYLDEFCKIFCNSVKF